MPSVMIEITITNTMPRGLPSLPVPAAATPTVPLMSLIAGRVSQAGMRDATNARRQHRHSDSGRGALAVDAGAVLIDELRLSLVAVSEEIRVETCECRVEFAARNHAYPK